MKRLVMLVEGDGDAAAAPLLAKRLLNECHAFDTVILDSQPFIVGEYSKIIAKEFADWQRYLAAAAKRKDFGGCLLLLDGDSRVKVGGKPFCAMRAARLLAAEARTAGGGSRFSVAVVFACLEFESWLMAGATSLVGKTFPDGRKVKLDAATAIPSEPESAPRDAKGWFRGMIETGYKPARDQAELTALVDIDAIRRGNMRSFRRLESALQELTNAFRSGVHVVTPTL